MTVDEFLRRWHALVARWADPQSVAGVSHAMLRDALATGLVTEPHLADAESGQVVSAEDAQACEIAVLRLSGLVDEVDYATHNMATVRRPDAVAHFCTKGWHTLSNPNIDFDVWWYWRTHLGLEELRVNPLLHYALVGRQLGLATSPTAPQRVTRSELPQDRPIRRACLFAAYDIDGVVDDYVVDYLRRLGKHCDIFYLADSYLSAREMAKLDDLTQAAWAIPHGRYDFGSYAMLADDLVGWARLDEYDEVIFANDSCYALTDFDHVFERMDSRPCDWWGLQASKFDFRDTGTKKLAPIPLVEAKTRFTGHPEWRQMLFLHISSYFLALRRTAFQDPGFREFIAQVAPQPDKTTIVLKYEIGLSRQLIGSGHDFDTYIDLLYPFHPVYNADTFTLIDAGFPLLKRTFLVENSTRTPGLAAWRQRVLDLVPDAPVDLIEHNLERVAPHDQLALSFAVSAGSDGRIEAPRIMPPKRLRREDEQTPTFEHWWAFPVSAASHQLSSDARAVFEVVRDDPSLKKVVLTRSRRVDLDGENTSVFPLNSPEGQHHLVRAGLVILSDPAAEAVPFGMLVNGHTLVDVTGSPELVSRPSGARTRRASKEGLMPLRPGVALTGPGLPSLTSVAPLDEDELPLVLTTGMPRADLVVLPDTRLPFDLRNQVEEIRTELDGRKLLLVAPMRPLPESLRRFSDSELDRWRDLLRRNDVVIGLRESPTDRSRTYARLFEPLDPLDLSFRRVAHIEVVYRLVAALVSDYGTCLSDFMLTGRPVLSFAPGRGPEGMGGETLIDPTLVMPSPVTVTVPELLAALDDALGSADPGQTARYAWCRDLLGQHTAGHNAWRAVIGLRRIQGRSTTTRPG